MSIPLLPGPGPPPPALDGNATITPNITTAPPASQPSTGSSQSPKPASPESAVPDASSGLPKGALAGLIVGIVIGALFVMIGVGIFVFIYRRRKKKRGEYASGFSGGPRPHGPKDNLYAGPPQNWQQNAVSTNNKVTMQSPPVTPPGIALYPGQSPMVVHNHDVPPSSGGSLGSEKPSHGITLGFSQNAFSYEELAAATNNFSSINLLGQGGFGYVHKGVLPDGKEVAIKQLKAGSGQGEREFQAEVDIISRVHHKHLVSLVGYCITGAQRMLVYEFVPNYTLEFHLHGSKRPTMNWLTRMKIALGSAKGLAYLHEDCHPKIIHRDIKAANILLDNNFEAKVADFGLAKSSLDTDTHVSTRVMGTFGYLAPEYASSGKLTEKSDVFSFGVVLLELITGRRPIDKNQYFTDDSMVDWARPLLAQAMETKNFDALADPRLEKDYSSSEMARMVACAAACVRHSARRRPQMSQVVRALEGNIALDDLNVGLAPGHSTVFSSFGSSDYDNSQYKEDMKKFRMLALGSSQEHGTSESGFTSEVHISASSSEGQQTTQEVDPGRMKKDTQIQIDGS